MEEGLNAGADKVIYGNNQMETVKCERIGWILESLVKVGRIRNVTVDDTRYLKQWSPERLCLQQTMPTA